MQINSLRIKLYRGWVVNDRFGISAFPLPRELTMVGGGKCLGQPRLPDSLFIGQLP